MKGKYTSRQVPETTLGLSGICRRLIIGKIRICGQSFQRKCSVLWQINWQPPHPVWYTLLNTTLTNTWYKCTIVLLVWAVLLFSWSFHSVTLYFRVSTQTDVTLVYWAHWHTQRQEASPFPSPALLRLRAVAADVLLLHCCSPLVYSSLGNSRL